MEAVMQSTVPDSLIRAVNKEQIAAPPYVPYEPCTSGNLNGGIFFISYRLSSARRYIGGVKSLYDAQQRLNSKWITSGRLALNYLNLHSLLL